MSERKTKNDEIRALNSWECREVGPDDPRGWWCDYDTIPANVTLTGVKQQNDELDELVSLAKEWLANASEDELRAHRALQVQSFVRGMTAKCEHGVADFEQCAECRK